MPIRPPALDDRRYEDLVAELVARIPAHTPEWTYPRAGDPGRTLIELFAWLGDALLYRVNLIPERQRLAFLRLLGQPLRSACPARGLVTVALKENKPLDAYAIRPPSSLKGPMSFEVRDEFTVLPVTSAAYYKRPVKSGEVADAVLAALAEFHGQGSGVSGYVTTPLFVEGRPVLDGFDVVADTADRSLWLALFAPNADPPEEQATTNKKVRDLLGESATGGRQLLNIGIVPALAIDDPLAPAAARAHVPHVWEMSVNTTGKVFDETTRWQPAYLALDEVADATSGLTRPGVVRLALPRAVIIHAPENDVRIDENAGVDNHPPRLDDETMAARLITWIRLRPTPPPSPAPAAQLQFQTGESAGNLQSVRLGFLNTVQEVEHLRLVWAGVNAIAIEQLVTRSNIIIGQSTGAADQEFQLPTGGIEPETLRLQVEEESGWVTWQRVDDLVTLERDAGAARDARAFELDAAAGTIRFGDGMRGRIPAGGARIRAALYRSGGGIAGNLPAGGLKTIAATTLDGAEVGNNFSVTQPLMFSGGAEAETLAEAEKRIPARLRHRERAVTGDDYKNLARETPGVSVGRVELLPRFKPQQRHDEIPGVVTVMALPDRPLAPAPNPRADRPFLEAIFAWLDPRRPLAVELYVIGCEYVPVAVSVTVTVGETAAPETTLLAVKDGLVRVLWPLAGGGFDEQGWPLGRALSNRELAVEVARVSGVSEVAGLNLFTKNNSSGAWVPVGDSRDGREQNIRLERWQLPEVLEVVVLADETASGASLSIPAPSPATGSGTVGVPVVPDIC
jgi:predicted phage baseplate assembly protein